MQNYIIDILVGGKVSGKFELGKCSWKALKRASHAALSTFIGLKATGQDQMVELFGLTFPASLLAGLITQLLAMGLNWHRNRPR